MPPGPAITAEDGVRHSERMAEEALRQSEARFRALMEQAPFSVQVFAPDGRTIRVNRAWEDLWGIKAEEAGRYNILEDSQLEARGIQDYVRRAFAGQAARIPPIQYNPNETIPGITQQDDPRRWLSAVIYPLKDSAGRVSEVVLIHEDITARTLAEEALKENRDRLRESEEKLRLLANTIPQLAWMAHPDGHVFWYNRRWYEYTGTTPDQMESEGWRSVLDPDVVPKVLERWQESLRSDEPFDMVFPLRGADGEFRPFLTRISPLRDSDGRVLHWCGTNTDVSDIKRMEEALRETDRRKDEFLATLAHELRNPLAPIRNSLQILKMPRVDAKTARQTREMMERQVHHLVRLVDDLLDVSQVMRGKIELRAEPVELATVVARAVETAQPLIDIREHQLDIALPPDSLLVHADAIRVSQAIANLLMNAAKYTEGSGNIALSAAREDNEAVLRVRDNGIGIDPQMLAQVFDLFVQADHAASRSQGGLGLGLTLVKNIVEMHGGQVEAYSDGPGKGSEFVLRLPLLSSDAPDPEEIAPDERQQESAPPGHRLLVVDDNDDAARSLAMLLRLQGHDVQVANDGASALEVATALRPALIFLDLGMPGMDGYEVARRIRQTAGLQQTVLAALTGWGQQEDRRRTAEAGFDHHLVKPVEPKVLENLLADLKN